MLDVALSYAERGWAVFPCKGKTPLPRNGLLEATRDPARIRAWWKDYPRANIAIATGAASGVVVVDVDGPKGEEALDRLGQMPKTLQVATSKGRHLYFQRPAGEKWGNTSGRLPEIDTRGDGGYVMAPPSIHPSGKAYLWIDREHVIAPMPQFVIDAIYAPKPKPRPIPNPVAWEKVPPAYAQSAIDSECRAVASCTEGGRNHRLNVAAFSLGQLVGAGLLAESDAERELWNAAMQAGLEEEETHKTIASGLGAGRKQPRIVKPREQHSRPHLVRDEPEPEPDVPPEPEGFMLDEEQPSAEQLLWEAEVQRAKHELAAHGVGGDIKRERKRLFSTPASSLFAKEYPPTPWLVRGLLTEGAVFAVAGEPKTTKTWAGIELAMAIATATPAFQEFETLGEPKKVALFLVEDSERSTRNRLRALAASRALHPEEATSLMHVENLSTLDLANVDDLANIVASARALGSLAALVLDPLRDLHRAKEDDSGEMAVIMSALRALRSVIGCAVIFVHHSHKSTADNGKRRGGQRMRGSSVIHGSVDGGLYLFDLTGNLESEWVNKAQGEVKAARSAGYFSLKLSVEDEHGEAVRAEWIVTKDGKGTEPDPQAEAGRRIDDVMHLLSAASAPLPVRAIERQLKLGSGGATPVIKDLELRGMVTRTKAGVLKTALLAQVMKGAPAVRDGPQRSRDGPPVPVPFRGTGRDRNSPNSTGGPEVRPDGDEHDEFLHGPKEGR